jgi:RNA polymerase sigma-70 factor (ECF subfamily)
VGCEEAQINDQGRIRSLKELLVENYGYVFRFLAKMCGDAETAKDLTQDVMVRAIVSHGRFRGRSKFSTYLIAIAANLYRDGKRRKTTLPLDELPEGSDPDASPDERIVAMEDEERMRASILKLPLKLRQVLVLRTESACSYEEMAGILGCPVGTVRSRLHNAVDKLKTMMEERT